MVAMEEELPTEAGESPQAALWAEAHRISEGVAWSMAMSGKKLTVEARKRLFRQTVESLRSRTEFED